jgi:predicted amidohydrolase
VSGSLATNRSLTVAVVQTAPRVGMVAENVAAVEERIAGLGGRAELVLFPELFTTGYRRDGMDHAALAERLPEGPTVRRLAEAARRAGLAVAGTLLERDGESVFDTAILIGPDGDLLASYRKTHLYPAELAYFSPGEELVVAPLRDGVAVGLAICFEHAFPEIFTSLALRGAGLILIPSAVPRGYEYLLDLRTRARAQDNQVYVASANLVGFDGETDWCGGSAIVDPRGEVIAQAGREAETEIVATIEPGLIERERQQEPALEHRRPELYR